MTSILLPKLNEYDVLDPHSYLIILKFIVRGEGANGHLTHFNQSMVDVD